MSNISKIDNLVICSLNVRGLLNEIKGRETFNWLRNKKYSVYFLQEVHSSKVDIKTEDKILTLQNIYAPNNDVPNFFKSIFDNLSTFENVNI